MVRLSYSLYRAEAVPAALGPALVERQSEAVIAMPLKIVHFDDFFA